MTKFKEFSLLFYAISVQLGNADVLQNLIRTADIYYQTTSGEPHEIRLSEIETLKSTNDIKIIVHGFTSSRTHISIVPLHNAYMAAGKDNVFFADWEDAAKTDYATARSVVGRVAIHFAQMLEKFMNKHNVNASELHIIGHSLGAHIAGCIGDYFSGTLGRVTGLDPALPLFTPFANDSLHARAAKFVDVIHTDFPVFGDITPRGSIDFYPNFGHSPQPGCHNVDLIAASQLIIEKYSCSHNLAVILYAESIGLPFNFPAKPCALGAVLARKANRCFSGVQTNLESNASSLVYMGEQVNRKASGFYYLQTYEVPPYGMGKHILT